MHIDRIIIGIDASNIRLGGGITHLKEILNQFNQCNHGIEKVVVWGGRALLSEIRDSSWLVKVNPAALEGNLIRRVLWQIFSLRREIESNACNILFVPGGSCFANFSPMVTMCQNLIPFDSSEVFRNGFSLFTFKMMLLRYIQRRSFKQASGLIFLTSFSKLQVLKLIGEIKGEVTIISHGFNKIFLRTIFKSSDKDVLPENRPYKLIYVSNIAAYKNQNHVLEALHLLREQGYKLEITFVGPGESTYLKIFENKLKQLDPLGVWAHYKGSLSYDALVEQYTNSDIGIYASSCEAFGIILLEKMASSIPIACSNAGSMPDILQNGGIYFNPEDPISIAECIKRYLQSQQLMSEKSKIALELAKQYSWEICSQKTFSFIEEVVKNCQK
jgi:glycosyltransferase involved in cell wall biosynthesis